VDKGIVLFGFRAEEYPALMEPESDVEPRSGSRGGRRARFRFTSSLNDPPIVVQDGGRSHRHGEWTVLEPRAARVRERDEHRIGREESSR